MKTMSKQTVRKALYDRWRKMILRCTDPKHQDYHRYGERGITVAAEWQGPTGFETYLRFVVDDLARPNGLTLEQLLFPVGDGSPFTFDRFPDNDGPYEPGNLRWATPKQQADNKRGRAYATVDGAEMTRADAARAKGVDPDTASNRQRHGYAAADAISLPVGGHTAEARDRRDAVITAMIAAGHIVVDADGFVFDRGADGLKPLRVAPVADGRYLAVSISVRKQFHDLLDPRTLLARKRSGLYRDGFLHHRIVAIYHHPKPEDGSYCEVDHINRNGHDNRPSNLRWARPSANRPGRRTR